MQRPARLAFCSILFVFAAPLRAQSANAEATVLTPDTTRTAVAAPTISTASTPTAEASPVGGAPETGLRAAVHSKETARPDASMAAPAHANLGQARAMMGVGLAGLVVGAIIGGTPGTVIMVAGALIGLKGLYDYLQ